MRTASLLPYDPHLVAFRVAAIIEYKGVSKSDFARMLGRTDSNVSNWLAGRSRPGLDAARMIREFYGVPEKWLLFGSPGDLPSEMIELASVESRIRNAASKGNPKKYTKARSSSSEAP